MVVFTRQRNAGRLRLVYWEGCRNESDTAQREKYLKTAWGKRYIKNRLRRSGGRSAGTGRARALPRRFRQEFEDPRAADPGDGGRFSDKQLGAWRKRWFRQCERQNQSDGFDLKGNKFRRARFEHKR